MVVDEEGSKVESQGNVVALQENKVLTPDQASRFNKIKKVIDGKLSTLVKLLSSKDLSIQTLRYGECVL